MNDSDLAHVLSAALQECDGSSEDFVRVANRLYAERAEVAEMTQANDDLARRMREVLPDLASMTFEDVRRAIAAHPDALAGTDWDIRSSWGLGPGHGEGSMVRELTRQMEDAGYDMSPDRDIPSPLDVSGLASLHGAPLVTSSLAGPTPRPRIDPKKRKRLQKRQKAARRANR